MIKSVELKNFQSHIKNKLDFVPGVNAIVGCSDSGKSAIIRAMNWVTTNRPSGADFLNNSMDKKDSCKVTLITDMCEVVREKNNRTGANLINNYVIDGQELKAMGVGIPDEVKAGLNVTDLNIQYQIDSPFLLSESPGEVARVFNKVVNLDIIDRSLSKAESEKRSINGNIKLLKEHVLNLEADLKAFDAIPAMESDLKRLERLNIQISAENKAYDDIVAIINKYDEIKDIKFPILVAENNIEKLLQFEKDVIAERKNLEAINKNIDDFYSYSRPLGKCNRVIKAETEILQLLKIDTSREKIDNLKTAIETFKSAKEKVNQYEKLSAVNIDRLITLQKSNLELSKNITALHKYLDTYKITTKAINDLNLEELEKEFYKMLPAKCSPEICPLLAGVVK